MTHGSRETSGLWWTPDGFVKGVCHHDAWVRSIEPTTTVPDSGPLFLPAPVDLHVHGGGGHDCMSSDAAIRGMLQTHARHGTGSLLATSVTAPFDDITRFVESVARVMDESDDQSITLLGAHLEGPFISPDKLGAQPPYAASLNLDQAEAWFDSGIVRVITYAPEIDPHGELVALCQRYGVRIQLGHTVCTWHQAKHALDAGCGVTHLYNAMSGVSHRCGGAATAALAYAQYAEIITDGLHVEQAAFDAARRSIPGLYSVTDATAATGMPDGEYHLGSLSVHKSGEKVLLPDGTLAGSCLTQRRSASILRGWGLDWHTIGKLISATPAKWIADETVGRIAAGARAHWLEIQNDEPVALWLSGERIAWEGLMMSNINTPDIIYKELFHAVQNSQLLGDSKSFVDAVPKGEPAAIVADFLSRRQQPDFDLSAFVSANFELPESDEMNLHSEDQKPVREHIERIWEVLTRTQDAKQPHSSLLALPNPYIVPGGRFREIYYWDSYFTMLGLADAGRTDMIRSMVANFAFLIDQIGFVPNGNRSYYCTRSQPPFFALMVELLAQTTQDQGIYRQYLPQLQREYDFWMAGAETLDTTHPASRRVVLAGDTCLNRYWDDSCLPRQESHAEDVELADGCERDAASLYRDIRAGAESGWDYSSRWFADGQDMATIQTTEVIPVDLNCLMYKLESVLAIAYQLAGDDEQQLEYETLAAARQHAIQTKFFDDETGFFADLLWPILQPKPSLSLAAAYPLFLELATPAQAGAVAAQIHSRFLKPGGWVTTLVNTGQQWDSPNGWAPLQWIVYRGLTSYGYHKEAEAGARCWIDNNLEVYRSAGALVEKYNVEQPGVLAGGGEYEVQDGFGWTNAVLLRLMDELGE